MGQFSKSIAWQTAEAWPARVAAEMAAELGVDVHRLQTMMDTRLREHLAARHDVRVSVG